MKNSLNKSVTNFILTFFSILLYFSAHSQTTEVIGIVKDRQTNETISNVNIYFKTNGEINAFGAITNELGAFKINNLQTVNEVIFSHINYIEKIFKVSELQNDTEIYLEPKIFFLEEVVLSKTKPKDDLKNYIKNSVNTLEKNIVLNSYSREITKLNGDYLNISDAMIDFHITKSTGKAKLVLKQSRAFVTDSTNFKKSLAAYDVKKYIDNAYDFSLIKKIIKDKNYQFERINKKDHSGNEYEWIFIIPNKNAEEFLFEGYVLIDTQKKTIKEIKIYSSEWHRKYAKTANILLFKMKFDYFMEWSSFNYIDNQYVLEFYNDKTNMTFLTKEDEEYNFEHSYFTFIQDFKKDIEIPKDTYEKKSIYEAGTKFSSEYWNTSKSSPFTDDEQKFLNTFNKL